MANRYRFFDLIYNADLSHTQIGFPTNQLSELFSFNDNVSYRIPIEHQYRPDLIANKFYGDPRLFWVLVYANNFAHSPDDFVLNSIIKIPRYEKVISII
jgi:hypothetical protein